MKTAIVMLVLLLSGCLVWQSYATKMAHYVVIKSLHTENEPGFLKRMLGYTNESNSPVFPFFGFEAMFVVCVLMCLTVLIYWF